MMDVYEKKPIEEPNSIEKKRKKTAISKAKMQKLMNQNPFYAIFGKDYLLYLHKNRK